MRILVTGAAGFIGAHLVRELSKVSENEILAVDSYSKYYAVDLKMKRINALLPGFENGIYKVDLRDASTTQSLVKNFQPQMIYHLAAQAGVRTPVENYNNYFENNLLAFSNIITAAVLSNTSDFIYASSSSVYGNRDSGNFRESELDIQPSSIYGSTKLSNEVTARAFSARHGIRTRGLRYFTVYGPWGRPDMAYFRIINSILNRSEFRLFGDGNIRRDFTYITDAVELSIRLGNALRKEREHFSDIVNLGGGQSKSLKEMISYLEHKLGHTMPVSMSAYDLSDVKQTHADSTYLKSLVEFNDFVPMESGLDQVFDWAINQTTKENLMNWSNSVG